MAVRAELQADYQNVGKYELVNLKDEPSMKVYRTGNRSSQAVLYVFPDVYGAHVIRTRAMCDMLSKDLRCEVVMPDLLLGDSAKGLNVGSSEYMSKVKEFTADKLVPRAKQVMDKEQKSRKIFFLGVSHGAYIALHLGQGAEKYRYPAAAAWHPSCYVADTLYKGEGQPTAQELCEGNKVPFMMFPATGEQATEGELFACMCNGSQTTDQFLDQEPGFMARGDLNKEEVKDAVEACTAQTVAYFKDHISRNTAPACCGLF